MFKKKRQSSENLREASDTSGSNGSSAVPSDDPSQPIDLSTLPEEWSPDQKIYPDGVNVEPESVGLQFKDPIAEKTEWEFVASGAIEATRLKLANTDSSKMEFTSNTMWIGIALTVASIIIGSIFVLEFVLGKVSFQSAHFMPFLFSVAGIVIGIILSSAVQHMVFDKYKGVFWKGWTIGRAKKISCSAQLADIWAIQLIDEWQEGEGSFLVYQLNLVLKDASRVNVFEDKKHKLIRDLAKTIAEFLGTPVWDAT